MEKTATEIQKERIAQIEKKGDKTFGQRERGDFNFGKRKRLSAHLHYEKIQERRILGHLFCHVETLQAERKSDAL